MVVPGCTQTEAPASSSAELTLERLAHHEALAVVIVDAGELQPERGVARHRPGGVAGEHVDLARLQRGEAVLRGQRRELDLGRVVEDRRRDRPAEIDVEAGPAPLRVRQPEAGEHTVRSAVEHAPLLDRVEGLSRCRRGGNRQGRRKRCADDDAFHDPNSQNAGSAAGRCMHRRPWFPLDPPRPGHHRTGRQAGQGVAIAALVAVNANGDRNSSNDQEPAFRARYAGDIRSGNPFADMSAPSDIVMMDALALSRAIQSKQVSCVEVMNAYLDHIGRLNPAVNAIVSLQDRGDLIAQATARDQELARGEYRGWMHGFPQAIKDLTATKASARRRARASSRISSPAADAIHVERVKRAGAIVIGKTNTPEFGLGSNTYNDVFGRTLNATTRARPRADRAAAPASRSRCACCRSPTAPTTAARSAIRRAYNNVFGFRPSFGRVPANALDVLLCHHGHRPARWRAMCPTSRCCFRCRPATIRARRCRTGKDPADFAGPLKRDFKGTRIAWGGDFGGHLPFEPGILDLCKYRAEGVRIARLHGRGGRARLPDRAGLAELEGAARLAVRLGAEGALCRSRQARPDEARGAVRGRKRPTSSTAYDIYDADVVRTAWYQAVRAFFERYDYFLLPSSQVFPFDADTDWPKQIAGRTMDTYHRWMEVDDPGHHGELPGAVGARRFQRRRLADGNADRRAAITASSRCLQLAHAYDEMTKWVTKRPPSLLGK